MVDVTVLTPSRNYAEFIEDTILSVRGQHGVTVQHVVQDAASTDETPAVLARHAAYVEWASEPDRSQSDALNKAFTKATGRWIGWLNADEFYLPDALATLVTAGERTGADVVYGDCVIVDERGRVRRLLAHHPFSPRVLRNYGPSLSSCSAVFRRTALETNPWDVDIRRVMDWDLYLKLLERGATFRHVPYPAGAFRTHPGQVTAAPWHVWQEEDERIAARYGRPIRLGERWKAYTRWRWLHRALKLVSGAYRRETLARAFIGRDLRWFASDAARADAVRFIERMSRWGRAEREHAPSSRPASSSQTRGSSESEQAS